MAAGNTRFVARTEDSGWRVYDRQQKKSWGDRYNVYPAQLLAELNGPKRPERIVQLTNELKRQ